MWPTSPLFSHMVCHPIGLHLQSTGLKLKLFKTSRVERAKYQSKRRPSAPRTVYDCTGHLPLTKWDGLLACILEHTCIFFQMLNTGHSGRRKMVLPCVTSLTSFRNTLWPQGTSFPCSLEVAGFDLVPKTQVFFFFFSLSSPELGHTPCKFPQMWKPGLLITSKNAGHQIYLA